MLRARRAARNPTCRRAVASAIRTTRFAPLAECWSCHALTMITAVHQQTGKLLERHARQRTAHPALIRKIIGAPGGRTPAAPAAVPPQHLPEPLSQAEARVLRFLQTSLSAPEIARELYVSVNTVRTHMRHLYDKLGAHRRLEAIDRARAAGLLAPALQRALVHRVRQRRGG